MDLSPMGALCSFKVSLKVLIRLKGPCSAVVATGLTETLTTPIITASGSFSFLALILASHASSRMKNVNEGGQMYSDSTQWKEAAYLVQAY